jgi:hypothetical protein
MAHQFTSESFGTQEGQPHSAVRRDNRVHSLAYLLREIAPLTPEKCLTIELCSVLLGPARRADTQDDLTRALFD